MKALTAYIHSGKNSFNINKSAITLADNVNKEYIIGKERNDSRNPLFILIWTKTQLGCEFMSHHLLIDICAIRMDDLVLRRIYVAVPPRERAFTLGSLLVHFLLAFLA